MRPIHYVSAANFSFGSRTVLSVTSAERQLTLRFRTKSLQRESRQFGANEQRRSRASLLRQAGRMMIVGADGRR